MPDSIEDGTGHGYKARVTKGKRLTTLSVSIPFSGMCSYMNRLFSVGTGSITLTAGGERPVLWMRNDDNLNDYWVTDIIFGNDGGSTNFNRTFGSLIYYNTAVPSAGNTAANAESENIKFSNADGPDTLNNFTGHKWDGVTGTGMTSGSGGFPKIPNRLGQGNDSLDTSGEIILSKGKAMELRVTPQETGLFNVAIVFAVIPIGGIEELL